jgi:hypothetical protein
VAGGRRRGRRRQLLGLDGEAHPAEAVSVAADEVVGLGLVELEREAAALAVVVDGVAGVALVVPGLVHLHYVRLPRRVVEHCARENRAGSDFRREEDSDLGTQTKRSRSMQCAAYRASRPCRRGCAASPSRSSWCWASS